MTTDSEDRREGFLGRWSRVKTQAREAAAAPAEVPQDPRADAMQEEPPALPAIDELTLDSDYRGFFHPKVDESVRRSALRKLFRDPHFNVMDGLDVYIDDYSKSEPIPAAMLAGLKQAQRIIEWASETEEAAAIRRSVPPQLEMPAQDDEPQHADPLAPPVTGADERLSEAVPGPLEAAAPPEPRLASEPSPEAGS